MGTPVIQSGEVTLRPWGTDEVDLYLSLRDVEVFRFTTEDPDLDREHCRLDFVGEGRSESSARFALCGPDGRPVGNLTVDRFGDRAAIAYWLAPQARGRGWAAEALRAATQWAAANWPVGHIELEIHPENTASVRVAQAAGYARHGLRLESACGGPALLYRKAVDSESSLV